ncbi:S-adenosylmethionine:tRNA ribosyltransferase-isomerase [Kribbella deserti]|uniref:S-adenosylmethionine:tRNA ribosyltransferase-isomerase n=1 Tax=Kribbella deserti TaxID=1926257 RepID=A0ABV6QTS6_9ACTN
MTAHPLTRFTLPDELNAAEPPEARGMQRDEVRLLVADGEVIAHKRFYQLPAALRPGDLLVVNTSGTMAAAADGTRITARGVDPVVVHFSTELDDGTWVIELRTAPDAGSPLLTAEAGDQVELPGGNRITLLMPYNPRNATYDGVRLWQAKVEPAAVREFLERYGRPIAYKYVGARWPIESYQTVFAHSPTSAEMPSAGRPFTTELVTRLVTSGVLIAPIRLDTGVSSLESHEPPTAERYDVPAATARLVNHVRANGGRVVAVGTTAVRALESAAAPDGTVRPSSGWTDLVLGPDRLARVVDGLITGMHAPDASHLLLLEAVAGGHLVQRAYDAALERGYLWHEFGDLCLLLPAETP